MQVTYLKCGSVVLGFSSNHIYGDARCSFHFIQTWASITRGDLSSIVAPSFDKTPLRARSPPVVKFDHPEYTSQTTSSTLAESTTANFRISKEQLLSLKSRCSSRATGAKVSTFSVVVSLVWNCYCEAQGLDPDTTAHLMFTADIRGRLKPPLPKHHFSNAIVRKSLESKVSEITSNPLQVVAERVKAAVDSVDHEYIRSLIDYLEILNKKVFATMEVPQSHLRVVSTLGMPTFDANFGWGAPQLASRWKVSGNRVVYISDEAGVNGGVQVTITMDSTTMPHFEKLFHEELNAQIQICRSKL